MKFSDFFFQEAREQMFVERGWAKKLFAKKIKNERISLKRLKYGVTRKNSFPLIYNKLLQ